MIQTSLVETLTGWSTVVVGVAAVVALVLPMLDWRRHRKSVNAAISADAYAVRRTLNSWIFSAVHLEAVGGSPRTLVLGQQDKAVEERLQRAVAAAPHASRRVAKAIREAYVLYYRATAQGQMENVTVAPLAVMQACVARLTDAIEPELREREQLSLGGPSAAKTSPPSSGVDWPPKIEPEIRSDETKGRRA